VDAVAVDRRVIALQVTNEVNFPLSADSSDGAYRNAERALIAGVIAAKDEAHRAGRARLRIGFNWFYRSAPGLEESFWSKLRDPAFLAALDWVGLDAYPGTFFPPLDTPGGERDAVVNALGVLRDCLMPLAGIPARVPIRVEENGWPTGLGIRTPAQQATVLRTMVQAFSDYRGTYNVSDYRWFDLRDADSSSPNFQQQYGLLRSDYRPKPAFAAYRDEIARLTG
jgi:hypothetical protein